MDMPQTTAADKKREAEYRAEEDLRTLARAAEIKSDAGRMKAARAMARKQMKELQSVAKED
jgi:hypothetical protein